MKYGHTLILIGVASTLLLATPPRASAQTGSATASDQSARVGGDSAQSNSAQSKVSKTGEAIKDAYHEAATAVSDTAITIEVKAGLHENKLTRSGDIQVHTNEGVVTLQGTVKSDEAVSAAQKVAQEASGVKEVRNELTMLPTAIR